MPAPDADLVSVVIPTRNRCDLLAKAIDSVRRQSWPRVQVIVVDDGSTDGTPDLLARLAADDGALVVIRNAAPRGGAGARNQGIEAAAGSWIAFLDDDDLWSPGKLEKQLALLKANPSASAASCHYFYKAPFRPRRIIRAVAGLTEQQMLSGNKLGGASVCMASTRTLRSIGGFDPSLRGGQDWELWLRLFDRGPILVCDDPLVQYESHRGHRITSDLASVYAAKRRIYFRHRSRMTAETRESNVAYLLCLRACVERTTLRRRLGLLGGVFRLVGFREGLPYLRWFMSARLLTGAREAARS